MQGKQNMTNTERKGPHKSMHCRFCKPRGVVTPEKPIPAQMEAKTNIHLVHEAADLRLCNIHEEPGFPVIESEACVCILEGENPCPKCVPDKTRPPPKKKVCNCPKGAKPHPSMYNKTVPKKKKQKEEDDEFWWEKYSREHDALAQETWAAYMAHRRKEKKLEKIKKLEQKKVMSDLTKKGPKWYQKLSCQQVMYTEFLSNAIRLDADENIVDRTYFVLGGIGIYPRPKKKLLKRCIRYCHYNAIQFLKQLHMLTKDEDPFHENWQNKPAKYFYTWNTKLIMNCICHLEFPAVLREIMERLPPLPREKLLPQIPYPEFPKLPIKKYQSPYEEPLWQDRLNWSEKMKIDRLNRCRAHMENKRMKIPYLALVKRPSLIDARPPFLAQIMANERASRTLRNEEEKKRRRKHPISTFNSAVDVTAIAGIEASDISSTDKADTDDICVFLRSPKEPESVVGEMEEEPDCLFEKEVKFLEEPKPEETEIHQIKVYTDFSDNSEEERETDDIPFRTPQKTESGVTITSLCPPPDTTPGPPATHFERGKRELDIMREEICEFTPFVSSSSHMIMDNISNEKDDVEFKLKSAAEKLQELVEEPTKGDEQSSNKKHKKSRKKEKCKKRRKNKKKKKIPKRSKKLAVTGLSELTQHDDEEEQKKVKLEEEEEEEEEEEDEEEEDGMYRIDKIKREKEEESVRVASEMSDPDPDSDDEWSTRLPCDPDAKKLTENKNPKTKRTIKRIGKHKKRKSRKKGNNRVIELEEEKGEYMKKKVEVKEEKETAEDSDSSSKEKKQVTITEVEEKKEEPVRDVFHGNVKPLVEEILKDLAEEGFVCATYSNINEHPDILQLIMHLQGIIINEKLKQKLHLRMKSCWLTLKGEKKFPIPELHISKSKQPKLNWNDKKWVSRLAKAKTDEFYYKVACSRAEQGTKFYTTLYQSYFGTDRYLQIFYAYMISKYKDAILRGILE